MSRIQVIDAGRVIGTVDVMWRWSDGRALFSATNGQTIYVPIVSTAIIGGSTTYYVEASREVAETLPGWESL